MKLSLSGLGRKYVTRAFKSLWSQSVAIGRECERAKRGWSGSNLGYHATVYYENLEPKPSGFSSEWGLMDAYLPPESRMAGHGLPSRNRRDSPTRGKPGH